MVRHAARTRRDAYLPASIRSRGTFPGWHRTGRARPHLLELHAWWWSGAPLAATGSRTAHPPPTHQANERAPGRLRSVYISHSAHRWLFPAPHADRCRAYFSKRRSYHTVECAPLGVFYPHALGARREER